MYAHFFFYGNTCVSENCKANNSGNDIGLGGENCFHRLAAFHSEGNQNLRDHRLNRPSKPRSPAAKTAI
jgi:hypothetical protein